MSFYFENCQACLSVTNLAIAAAFVASRSGQSSSV